MQKPLFYNFRPFILASKFNQRIMFFQTSCLEVDILISLFFIKGSFWDPFKIQRAPTRDRQSTKWRNVGEQYRGGTLSGPTRKTQVHAETPSGLNLRFSFVFFIFIILAVQMSTNTWFFMFFGNAKYIEKHQAEEPSEIRWQPKRKQQQQQQQQQQKQEAPSAGRFSMYLFFPTSTV